MPNQLSRSENKTILLQLFSRWERSDIGEASSNLSSDKLTQGEFLYYDTKALFVQIFRLNLNLIQPNVNLRSVAETCASATNKTAKAKGVKLMDMLTALEVQTHSQNHQILIEEIIQEIKYLGDLRVKVDVEMKSLESVYKTIQDHNQFLRGQLDTYKSYLQNVRMQQSSAPKSSKTKAITIAKHSHQKLEQEGVITSSNVPEGRKANVYIEISQPQPGCFLIAMHMKGRPQAILEMDLKLDDLLEKQQQGTTNLDLEYVKMDISKIVVLLNRSFK